MPHVKRAITILALGFQLSALGFLTGCTAPREQWPLLDDPMEPTTRR